MNRITFCTNCGQVTDEDDVMHRDQECWGCGAKNKFVAINLTYEQAQQEYEEEIDKICKERSMKERGKSYYPLSWKVDMLNEKLREEYFYGKLDQSASASAIHDREYRSTDEYQNKRYQESKEYQRKQAEKEASTPKCPVCGSKDLKRITVVGKVAKVKMFGLLGAGDLGKTYKCNNCGMKF